MCHSLMFINYVRAGNTFCKMACDMLAAIGDYLHTGTEEIITNIKYLLEELVDDDGDEDEEDTFDR